MSDALVVNASPLIFLGNAGRLELLRTVDSCRVIVPQIVFDEVTKAGSTDLAARSVGAADWLECVPSPPVPTAIVEWDLGPGESAVIATALATAGARAVLDDLSARKCALAIGLPILGTLGVVIAAHRRGVVGNPRQVLLELRARGMWLSDAVVDRALRLAGVEP
jgi:predicted nucleic acid-binding protein